MYCMTELWEGLNTMQECEEELAKVDADLLQLPDLVVEVVNATLILQAELREQVSAELSLQGLACALHGMQTGLQTLQTALL